MTWREDTFAFAENFDEKKDRYTGLRAGVVVNVSADGFFGLVVKPDVVQQQMAHDQPTPVAAGQEQLTGGAARGADTRPDAGKPAAPAPPKRFYGTVKIAAARMNRDVSTISQEVVQHLVGLLTADVEVTLEIQASIPEGVPDNVVRTVSENCNTLKFTSHGFEKE